MPGRGASARKPEKLSPPFASLASDGAAYEVLHPNGGEMING